MRIRLCRLRLVDPMDRGRASRCIRRRICRCRCIMAGRIWGGILRLLLFRSLLRSIRRGRIGLVNRSLGLRCLSNLLPLQGDLSCQDRLVSRAHRGGPGSLMIRSRRRLTIYMKSRGILIGCRIHLVRRCSADVLMRVWTRVYFSAEV